MALEFLGEIADLPWVESAYKAATQTIAGSADFPVSVACFARWRSGQPIPNTSKTLWSVDKAAGHYVTLRFDKRASNGNCNFHIWDGSNSGIAIYDLGIGAGNMDTNWHHCAGVAGSDNKPTVYFDGTPATGAVASTPAALTDTSVGGLGNTTGSGTCWDGDISRVAVWKGYALTQADVNALKAGIHPYHIGRGFLLNYWPLRGDGPPGTRIRDLGPAGAHLLLDGTAPNKVDSIHARRGGGP